MSVSAESEKVWIPYDTTKPIVEAIPTETARAVKFSWEMPIRVWKESVVKSSVDAILKAGLFAGIMPTLSVADSSGSFAVKFQSGTYEIVASGCRITSAEFTGKPGEPLRLKIEGLGLFVSESVSATPLSPSPTFGSLILTRATSTSGEFASYFEEFSVEVAAERHLIKDLTSQYIVSQIVPTTLKISGSIKGLTEIIGVKSIGDMLSSAGITFNGNGNNNTLQFTFTAPRVSERKVGEVGNILYTDLDFVAAGLTLTFASN
ncbi:MAG: hypothetical protein WBI96_00020 [Candidatus Hydrothermia bacterium]